MTAVDATEGSPDAGVPSATVELDVTFPVATSIRNKCVSVTGVDGL